MSSGMWDQRFSAESFFYGTEPNDFLREQAGLIPAGGDVLCLGEGEGRNAVFLAGLGFRVTALDLSPVGLAKAVRLAEASGVHIETLVADLADYRFDVGRWDAIVAIWCHLPSALRTVVHGSLASALRPGGVVLLECYTPAQLAFGTGGPKDVDMLPTLDGLSRELAGLDFVVARACEREIHEGQGHSGRSAVAQMAARRRERMD